MIEVLRRYTRSWVALIVIGFLILAFIVFIPTDQVVFSGGGGTVAEVGEETITAREFRRAYAQQIAAFNRGSSTPITQENAPALQLHIGTLNQLITDAALRQEARRLGVEASDQAVIDAIASEPGFRNAEGAFDPQIYEFALRQTGLRQVEYEEEVRAQLTSSLIAVGLGAGVQTPAAAAEALWSWRNERRALDYVSLDLETTPTPDEPDTATLQTYYDANSERYAAPEIRSFDVLWLRVDDVVRPEEVSPQAIEERYERDRNRFGAPERRSIAQLRFPNEDGARAAADRIADGESFERVAADLGQGAGQTDLGYVARRDLTALGADAVEAIFAVEGEGVAGPVRTAFGWTLFEIRGIQAASQTPLEEVRDEIALAIASDEARRGLPDLANDIEDQRAGGADLSQIASAEGFTLRRLEIDATGLQADGTEPAEAPDDPNLTTRAFALAEG